MANVNVKDLFARGATKFHQAVFDTSRGRLFGKAFGMPVVRLTTRGRKSGKPRHTMLTTPVHDDNQVVLIASYGGDSRHPAWYLNLRDRPEVTITMEGRTRQMVAHTANAEERAEL